MGVNGVAAANRMRGFSNLQHGMCLFYVWQAYKAEGATASRSYPTAYDGWLGSPGKHEGDRNPPAGVPVWFGPKAGSRAGDVVISLGGGLVVATDYPRYGVIGVCTIQQRQDQIGRPYLGWTETILGAPIDFQRGGEPANVGGGQRTAGDQGVKRRSQPTSQSAEAGEYLAPGVVGNFDGWVRGENVQGNDIWFRGISGNWFWSGGFREGANTSGLADLNAPSMSAQQRRTTVELNGRTQPSTSAQVAQTLPAGTVGNFDGWARGTSVDGEDRWLHGAISGNWFWLGGLEPRNTDGLADLGAPTPAPQPTPDPTPTPTPTDANNPRGLPTYQPVYPGAVIGLQAPLGDGQRGLKGNPSVAVPKIIDTFMLHRTGTDGDDLGYFSWKNERGSCPTWHAMPDGTTRELIRPGMKPSATGPEWNWRTVAIEVQGSGDGTAALFERVADILAWLASYDGRELDGIPVSFKLDRQHLKDHREVLPTECPGDWWHSRLDALLERARVIYAAKYAPSTPEEPQEPEPQPNEPDTATGIIAAIKALLDRLAALLRGK